MTANRPDPKGRRDKSDVMQAALQAEAFQSLPDAEPSVLQYADDADAPEEVKASRDAVYDEHEWDDVVQQTFPASDAPPPPGG